jgi:ankyrin repeat protein
MFFLFMHILFHFNADVQVVSSLEAGCPVDIRDTAGNTLFIIASQNGNKNMCKVIAMKNSTHNSIHKFIIKLLQALLRRGADINAANHRGQVSLHFCYQYGFADLAAYAACTANNDASHYHM